MAVNIAIYFFFFRSSFSPQAHSTFIKLFCLNSFVISFSVMLLGLRCRKKNVILCPLRDWLCKPWLMLFTNMTQEPYDSDCYHIMTVNCRKVKNLSMPGFRLWVLDFRSNTFPCMTLDKLLLLNLSLSIK